MIELTLDPATLDDASRRLAKVPYALQRAIMPAVSEMLKGVREEVAERLQSEVPLPAKLLEKAIRISGVTVKGNGVEGEILVKGKHVPLIHYDAQPSDITAQAGISSKNWSGFTYALRTGERRASVNLIEGRGLPFIARMKGGHLGVYYRPGYKAGLGRGRQSKLWGTGARGEKDHDSIKEMYGPEVQYHIADPAVEEAVNSRVSAEFPGIMDRYVEQAIAEYGGAA